METDRVEGLRCRQADNLISLFVQPFDRVYGGHGNSQDELSWAAAPERFQRRAYACPCCDAIVHHDQGSALKRHARSSLEVKLAPALDLCKLVLGLLFKVGLSHPGQSEGLLVHDELRGRAIDDR